MHPLEPLKVLVAALVGTVTAILVLSVSYAVVIMIALRQLIPAANIVHVLQLFAFFGFVPALVSVMAAGVPAFLLLRRRRDGRSLFLSGAAVVGAVVSLAIWSYLWSSVRDGSMMIVPGAVSGLAGGLAIWSIGNHRRVEVRASSGTPRSNLEN